MNNFNLYFFYLLLSTFILCVSFVIHTIAKFRKSANRLFLIYWSTFWILLGLLYLFSIITRLSAAGILTHTYIDLVETPYFIIDLLQPLSLILSSIYFEQRSNKRKYIEIAIWVLFFGIILGFSFVYKSIDYNIILMVSYAISSLAFTFYAIRFTGATKNQFEWVSVLVHLYAILLFFCVALSFSHRIPLHDFVETISTIEGLTLISFLPLKIALYFSGYYYLNLNVRPQAQSTNRKDKPFFSRVKKAFFKRESQVSPPDPNVEISLTGIYAFLYLLWKYPSGKFVVFFILITLVLTLAFIIKNFSILIDFFVK